jgi:hypothetical protein
VVAAQWQPGNPPDITVNGPDQHDGRRGWRQPVPDPEPDPADRLRARPGVDRGAACSPPSPAPARPPTRRWPDGGWSLRIADVAGSSHNAALAASGPAVAARVYLRPPAASGQRDRAARPRRSCRERPQARTGPTSGSRSGSARAVTASAASVSAATWYRLDLLLRANTNPRSADWQLDGVAQVPLSSAGAASTVNRLRLGSAVATDVYIANYDDVMLSATAGDYPIGEGTVVPLRPDGVGTHSSPASFRHEDGSAIDATTHLRLDDDPAATATDYVRQEAASAVAYPELGLGDTSAGRIVGVSGMSLTTPRRLRRTTAGRGLHADGAILFSGDMSEAALSYRSAIVPRPTGWTTPAVNALRARLGYSTDVSPQPYWDALLLEVATGTSTPGTVTVTASAGATIVVATYTDAGSAPPVLLSWSASR